MKQLACYFLLLGFVWPAQAEVYKWVDENGQVHFSDRPVDDNARQVEIDTSSSKPTTTPATPQQRMDKQRRLLRAFDEERRIKQEQQQKAQQLEAQRLQRCAEAKDRLKTYQNARGLYDFDKQGQKVFLDNQQRQQAEKKAQAAVNHWCRKE